MWASSSSAALASNDASGRVQARPLVQLPMAALHPDTALYADVDGTLIFLSVHANRFFALTRAREDAFRRSIGNELAYRGACVISRGELPRLCLAEDAPALLTTSIPVVKSAFRENELSGTFRIFLEAMFDRLLMKRLVRRGNLKRINDILHAARSERSTAGNPATVFGAANGAFRAVSSLINAENHCLALAAARAKFIIKRGIPVTCVVGVRLNPFSAHAWVQYGDLVIGDDPDFIRIHSPIAAL